MLTWWLPGFMSLSKTNYPLLSTGSTQEDKKPSQHDSNIVDWYVKHRQTDLQLISQQSQRDVVLAASVCLTLAVPQYSFGQFLSILDINDVS